MCSTCKVGFNLNDEMECEEPEEGESSGFPWWGIVLFIIIGLVIVGGAAFVIKRFVFDKS